MTLRVSCLLDLVVDLFLLNITTYIAILAVWHLKLHTHTSFVIFSFLLLFRIRSLYLLELGAELASSSNAISLLNERKWD